MKPLTYCPGCQGRLERFDKNEHIYQDVCATRCLVWYAQYYPNSYEDIELKYISFYTPNDIFGIYQYFAPSDVWPGVTHVYSNRITRREGKSSPILTLKDFEIDLSKLLQLEEKLAILVTFS
jgi:hypothetical protein